jgi:hypothetical protein
MRGHVRRPRRSRRLSRRFGRARVGVRHGSHPSLGRTWPREAQITLEAGNEPAQRVDSEIVPTKRNHRTDRPCSDFRQPAFGVGSEPDGSTYLGAGQPRRDRPVHPRIDAIEQHPSVQEGTVSPEEPCIAEQAKLAADGRPAQAEFLSEARRPQRADSHRGDDPTPRRIREQFDPWTIPLRHLDGQAWSHALHYRSPADPPQPDPRKRPPTALVPLGWNYLASDTDGADVRRVVGRADVRRGVGRADVRRGVGADVRRIRAPAMLPLGWNYLASDIDGADVRRVRGAQMFGGLWGAQTSGGPARAGDASAWLELSGERH